MARLVDVMAMVVVGGLLAAGCSFGGDDLTVCADRIERLDCSDQWQIDLAEHLGLNPPDSLTRKPGETAPPLTIEEQVAAENNDQRFALAVRRANQACQLMQGKQPAGERLGISRGLAKFLDDNVCPGDRSLIGA